MFLVKSRVCWCCATFVASLGAEKNKKNNPGFLHPPTEPSSLSFGPHHPPMPARIKPMRAEWPVTTRDLLHPTCPGKIPKNLCGSIASIVHFLQVKRSSLLLKSHQFCLHKPLFFSSNPTHCSWFTPFFSKFLAELPQQKTEISPGHPAAFSASPCVTLRMLTSRGPVNSGTAGSAERRNAGSGVFYMGNYLIITHRIHG